MVRKKAAQGSVMWESHGSDSVISRIYEEDDADFEPRSRWTKDLGAVEFEKRVMATVDTNKVVVAELKDLKVLRNLRLHLQHVARQGGPAFRLVTRKFPDGIKAKVQRVKQEK